MEPKETLKRLMLTVAVFSTLLLAACGEKLNQSSATESPIDYCGTSLFNAGGMELTLSNITQLASEGVNGDKHTRGIIMPGGAFQSIYHSGYNSSLYLLEGGAAFSGTSENSIYAPEVTGTENLMLATSPKVLERLADFAYNPDNTDMDDCLGNYYNTVNGAIQNIVFHSDGLSHEDQATLEQNSRFTVSRVAENNIGGANDVTIVVYDNNQLPIIFVKGKVMQGLLEPEIYQIVTSSDTDFKEMTRLIPQSMSLEEHYRNMVSGAYDDNPIAYVQDGTKVDSRTPITKPVTTAKGIPYSQLPLAV